VLDTGLSYLHAGERDAIALALRLQANALVIDERRGREAAEKRGLKVIGTVGVIAAAHEGGLLDLTEAFARLRQTTFHVSPKLLAAILRKYQGSTEEEGQSE
jgi:predicted nucleic acid-binding protein